VTTLPGVTFTGPPSTTRSCSRACPPPLAALLAEADGLAGSAELVRGEFTPPPPEPGAGA
jgi:hypothetical protein